MSRYTLADARDDFLLSLSGGAVSTETLKIHTLNVSRLVEAIGPTLPLLSVSGKDFRRWQATVNARVEAGEISPYTAHQQARDARQFGKWLEDERLVRTSPAKRLRLPKLPEDIPPKHISDIDLERVLEAAEQSGPRDYAIIRFLAATGARTEGVRSLRVGDVELNNCRAWVSEKGGKGRYVYFDDQTANALRAWLAARGKLEHDTFFVSLTGGGPMGRYTVRSLCIRLGKASGVEGHHNPHAFRHAYAKRLLDNGAPLETVRELLGHSSIDVTRKFYGPWDDARRAEAARQFDPMRKFNEAIESTP